MSRRRSRVVIAGDLESHSPPKLFIVTSPRTSGPGGLSLILLCRWESHQRQILKIEHHTESCVSDLVAFAFMFSKFYFNEFAQACSAFLDCLWRFPIDEWQERIHLIKSSQKAIKNRSYCSTDHSISLASHGSESQISRTIKCLPHFSFYFYPQLSHKSNHDSFQPFYHGNWRWCHHNVYSLFMCLVANKRKA